MSTIVYGGQFLLLVPDVLIAQLYITKQSFNLCHHIKFVFLSDERKQQVQFFCLLFFKTTPERETVEVLILCESSRCTFKVRSREESHASYDQTQLKDKVQPFPLFALRLVEPQMSQHLVVKAQRGFLRTSTCICDTRPVTCISNKAEVLLYPVTKP